MFNNLQQECFTLRLLPWYNVLYCTNVCDELTACWTAPPAGTLHTWSSFYNTNNSIRVCIRTVFTLNLTPQAGMHEQRTLQIHLALMSDCSHHRTFFSPLTHLPSLSFPLTCARTQPPGCFPACIYMCTFYFSLESLTLLRRVKLSLWCFFRNS